MASIEFTIADQKYVLHGDEPEEHLREVAELVRRKVEGLRKASPTLSLQKAAMLAAFDIASQAIKGKQKASDYRSTVLTKAQDLLDRVELELESLS